MHQITLHDQKPTNGHREVLDQSQINENQSEGQQDHRTIVGNLHKTTPNYQEFSGHERSATDLTPSVTGL